MKNDKIQPFRFNAVEKKDGKVIIEVKKEDYERDLASGIPEDELLKPGKHVFRRTKRVAVKEDLHPSNTKVQITIKLDLDVLNYFKERAAAPHAAPYQTQINNELRAIMEGDDKRNKEDIKAELLKDKNFIKAFAEKLKKVA